MPRGTVEENALNIFMDGSSFGSPRRGGVGVRFVQINSAGEEVVQDVEFLGHRNATNNQMELKACILALAEALRLGLIPQVDKVIIFTDSLYVADNYQKAMFEWPKAKWRTRSGRPVLNAQLWKELTTAMKRAGKRVDIKWVKGHSKSLHNRAVDKMARRSANVAVGRPLSAVHVRKKLSPGEVEVGSVIMRGQTMLIHIVTTEYLPVQGVWKAKYEVVSKGSPDYQCIDIVFSSHLLAAGHTYLVRVNDETKNPTVVEVLRELRDGDTSSPGGEEPGPSNNSLEPTFLAAGKLAQLLHLSGAKMDQPSQMPSGGSARGR